MVCVTILGVQLRIDFTAPALGAMLCMMLPLPAVLQMCLACILHEGSHFAALWYFGCHPRTLRISALGMELGGEHLTLYPPVQQAVILLSGAGMNLAVGCVCMLLGMADAAMWQFATALCNLLPYRCTDGGTLLYWLLDGALGAAYGHHLRSIWRIWSVTVTIVLSLLLLHLPACPISIWGILLFLFVWEWLR